jgi:DNA-binding beta-propeller fold protein YncE
MPRMTRRALRLSAACVALVCAWCVIAAAQQTASTPRPPMFEVDPKWPSIPNNWVLGEVSSIAVDSKDLHLGAASAAIDSRRQARERRAARCSSSTRRASCSRVGEERERLRLARARARDLGRLEELRVDQRQRRLAETDGAGQRRRHDLKFTPAGKFVMQIGHRGKSTGNMDTMNVHQPADVFVHTAAKELYVADGYGNQRVVVFDAEKGTFKRMWGAFGNMPTAEMRPNPPTPQPNQGGPDGPPQFGLVHAVKVSNDGIVYVADRTNNRVQTFTTQGKFLRQTRLAQQGTVTPVPAGFAFSPDKKQQYLYVVDSGPMQVAIFDRQTLTQIGTIGMRGPKPGDFDIVHHMAADSKGNLYTAEIVTNRRAQRFVNK